MAVIAQTGNILAGGIYIEGVDEHSRPLDWPGVPPNSPGTLDGIVEPGGLVRNTSSDGDIYENQNTKASPTFVRIDTLPV